jgi:hypothetical protein
LKASGANPNPIPVPVVTFSASPTSITAGQAPHLDPGRLSHLGTKRHKHQKRLAEVCGDGRARIQERSA